ncbi:MAG: hypothetical protein KF805_16975 [Phycisphaeraceae bacterium]|nr:hypothetical protein [Phycisphaeraceae bacterium]
MRSPVICLLTIGAGCIFQGCGKDSAQAPEPPKFVKEQQKKVADFKSKRGLDAEPKALSVNDRLAAELRRVRTAIAQYSESSRSLPWRPGQALSDQWNPFGFSQLPANPLSPDRNRTKIVEITRKGATGSLADPNEAGWVWNSADGKIFAAGSDE